MFPLFVLALIPNDNLVSRVIGSRPIYRLGVISYSIYLIHNQLNYFMWGLADKLQSFGMGGTSANVVAIFTFVLIVMGLAELSYRFIESPARNWLNGLVVKQLARTVTTTDTLILNKA